MQSSCGFDLSLKATARAFGRLQMVRQHFQGDRPLERDLLRAVHKAHTAGADLSLDEKVADLAAGTELGEFSFLADARKLHIGRIGVEKVAGMFMCGEKRPYFFCQRGVMIALACDPTISLLGRESERGLEQLQRRFRTFVRHAHFPFSARAGVGPWRLPSRASP
jgi:hypothetical protein